MGIIVYVKIWCVVTMKRVILPSVWLAAVLVAVAGAEVLVMVLVKPAESDANLKPRPVIGLEGLEWTSFGFGSDAGPAPDPDCTY